MNKKYFAHSFLIMLALFLFSSSSFAQIDEHPVEVGGFLTITDFNDSVGEKPLGIGGRAAYNFTKNFAIDGEVSFYPNYLNGGGGVSETVTVVGLKAGVRSEKFGVFGKIRPGIAHFDSESFRLRNNEPTKFALDVGGVLEYYPTKRIILRVDVGDTIIPFGDETRNIPVPPFIDRPGTTHNLQTSFGVGFRF